LGEIECFWGLDKNLGMRRFSVESARISVVAFLRSHCVPPFCACP
jgi:hypothetical protein